MNYRKIIFILTIINCYITSINAQDKNFFIQPPSSWINNIKPSDITGFSGNEADGGGKFLLLDNQINGITEEFYTHNAIKIINDAGIQNYSNIWINYLPSFQKLTFHKLLVYKGNKTENRLNREDFKIIQNEENLEQNIYREIYSAGIILENIEEGDIIEYSYTIEGTNPALKGNFSYITSLQYSVPVSKIYLSLLFQKDSAPGYKLINTEIEPQVINKGETINFIWEINNSEEIYIYSDIPPWYDPYPGVQFSSFNTWGDVVNWGRNLYPAIKNNIEITNKVNDLTDSITGLEGKISSLIRFVQDEVRYMGIEVEEYSFKPRDPVVVLNRLYGDCKDKSFLLSTLLKQLGLESEITYVNSSLGHMVLSYLPSPTIFNHAIVMFKFQGNQYWVDPTMSSQGGNFKNFYLGNNLHGLVLSPGNNDLIKIPQNSNEKIIIKEYLTIKDTITPVNYTVKSEYFGNEADNMRNSFKTSSKNEMEQSFLNFYSAIYPKMELKNELITEDNMQENCFRITENYQIPSFWQYDNSEDINDYVSTVNARNFTHFISVPDQRNRNMPFSVYHPIEIENEIIFNHCKRLNIEEISGEITNKAFTFSYEIAKAANNSVSFKYHYKTLKDHVPPDEMMIYYKDIDKISDLTYYQFTFGKDFIETGKINWFFVVLTLIFLFICFYIFNRLYKTDVPVQFEGDSKPFGGWLIIPTIGVFIFPLIIIIHIFSSGYYSIDGWHAIASKESGNYNFIWALTFIYELFINLFFLAYSVFLIVLIVNFRTIFPRNYVIFRLLNIALLAVDLALIHFIDSDAISLDKNDFKELGKSVFSAAIWIPYMLYSSRVKQTFLRKHKKKDSNKKDSE